MRQLKLLYDTKQIELVRVGIHEDVINDGDLVIDMHTGKARTILISEEEDRYSIKVEPNVLFKVDENVLYDDWARRISLRNEDRIQFNYPTLGKLQECYRRISQPFSIESRRVILKKDILRRIMF
jgi:hypothetical protein